MTCPDSHHWLRLSLDGDPNLDPVELEQHLAACPTCQELHAAVRSLEAGLGCLEPPPVPAGMADRIVTRVLDDRRAPSRGHGRWVRGFALAASILPLVWLGSAWYGNGTRWSVVAEVQGRLDQLTGRGPHRAVCTSNLKPLQVPLPETETPSQPEAPLPTLKESLAEAGSLVASLAGRTADEAVGQSRLLLPDRVRVPLPPVEAVAAPLELPSQPLQDAGQAVASGMEPVTTSARRWFDMVLRELPDVETERKPGL